MALKTPISDADDLTSVVNAHEVVVLYASASWEKNCAKFKESAIFEDIARDFNELGVQVCFRVFEPE